MPDDPVQFDKYQREGAYHWYLTDARWSNFDYNPPMEARFEVLVRELRRLDLDGASVLDVGCGDGFLLAQVAEAAPSASLFGIDVEAEAIDIARDLFGAAGIEAQVQQGSAYELPYDDASFDVAVMTEVIEHFDTPGEALAETARVLRPGGHLFVTTPHRQPDFDWDPEYHAHEFTWPELSSLLGRHFEDVTGKACFPMGWMRYWRRGASMRTAIRIYSRLFGNPMARTAEEPSAQYGQIIASGRTAR